MAGELARHETNHTSIKSEALCQRIATNNTDKTKKDDLSIILLVGGMDGTRTRDPLRDRQVF